MNECRLRDGWAPFPLNSFPHATFPRWHIPRNIIHHAQFCPAQLSSAQSAYPDCRQSNKHWNGVDMSGKQAALLLEQGWERRVESRSEYWVACYSDMRLHKERARTTPQLYSTPFNAARLKWFDRTGVSSVISVALFPFPTCIYRSAVKCRYTATLR